MGIALGGLALGVLSKDPAPSGARPQQLLFLQSPLPGRAFHGLGAPLPPSAPSLWG